MISLANISLLESKEHTVPRVIFLAYITSFFWVSNLFADVVFRDDFTGSSVRSEWKVIGEDPERMTLDGKHFLFLTTTDWRGLCYKGELPKDYTIELKTLAPSQSGTIIGVYLLESGENWISLEGNAEDSNYVLSFGKSLKGKASKHKETLSFPNGYPPQLENLLKVTTNGIEYRGYYSINEKKGQINYQQVFLNLNVKEICIEARNTDAEVPEIPVKFDYFEIRN